MSICCVISLWSTGDLFLCYLTIGHGRWWKVELLFFHWIEWPTRVVVWGRLGRKLFKPEQWSYIASGLESFGGKICLNFWGINILVELGIIFLQVYDLYNLLICIIHRLCNAKVFTDLIWLTLLKWSTVQIQQVISVE